MFARWRVAKHDTCNSVLYSYISISMLENVELCVGLAPQFVHVLARGMYSVLGSAMYQLLKAERGGGETTGDPGILMRCANMNATRMCVQLCA